MSRLGTAKCDPPSLLVRAIVADYAAQAGLPPEIIYTTDRRKAVSWIRAKVCQHLLKAGYTTLGIGRQLEIDHTTVVMARNKVLPDTAPALRRRISMLAVTNERIGLRVLALIETVPVIRVSAIARQLDICEQTASDAVRRLFRQGKILACPKPGHYRPLKYTAPVIQLSSVRVPETFIRPISKERMMAGR